LKKKTNFSELVKIMAKLRAPGGCPWDRAQTHESLLKYLKEEAQEVCEAVEKKDWENLEEELGDILLQVLFHSNMARERGDFDINDVLGTLKLKLITRHPHVFGKDAGKEELTPDEVKRRWNIIKEEERAKKRKKKERREKMPT
jgi:tetrapyrrole methylase family protein/MazG family protein